MDKWAVDKNVVYFDQTKIYADVEEDSRMCRVLRGKTSNYIDTLQAIARRCML